MVAGQANCQYGDDERDYNHDRADQGGPTGHSLVLAHPISKARHTDPRWVNRPRFVGGSIVEPGRVGAR
jgi:hypothetical protein